jgi:predicted transcriptional regulator
MHFVSVIRRHEPPTEIRQRRREAELSALDVARLTGFSVQKVHRIERAPLHAKASDLVAVSDAVDVIVATRGTGGGR